MATKKKTYTGQKAPFDLGFTVTNLTPELSLDFGVARMKKNYPIVIDVDSESQAEKSGLSVGDVIVDVNRGEVSKDTDVLKTLKNGKINRALFAFHARHEAGAFERAALVAPGGRVSHEGRLARQS